MKRLEHIGKDINLCHELNYPPEDLEVEKQNVYIEKFLVPRNLGKVIKKLKSKSIDLDYKDQW